MIDLKFELEKQSSADLKDFALQLAHDLFNGNIVSQELTDKRDNIEKKYGFAEIKELHYECEK